MKKILLALAFVFCAASVSAQGWAIGGRVTSGIQVQGEYQFENENYIEGRLGLGLINGTGLDFTALHQWSVCKMEWTPRAGQWFFDAGVGASVGMGGKTLFAGVTGDAKLGIKFKKVPIKLALDYSPCIGLWFVGNRSLDEGVGAGFNGTRASGSNGGGIKLRNQGFFNFGLSCVYCF
jgi:hypothetical protein